MKTYLKIEMVLKTAGRALAAHEFREVLIGWQMGDRYVGCSEATLARRLREMRELGRVTAKRREGKSFVEYALVEAPQAVVA